MTERKPPGTSFTSWIDQQIGEAQERGEFDNLPGAGKPLPRRSGADDGLTWVRELLRREGLPTDELLPTPLKLRKQSERLAESVQDLSSEQEVRDVVAELNRQIVEWRRIPHGPPIFVRLIDADAMVSRWRDRRAASATAAWRPVDSHRTAAAVQRAPAQSEPAQPARAGFWRRGWRRLRRHGRELETGPGQGD
jgi:Domain of unknown function (DUF1992)